MLALKLAPKLKCSLDLADRLQVFVAANDREAALRMFLPEAIGHSNEAIKQMPQPFPIIQAILQNIGHSALRHVWPRSSEM